MPAKDGPNVSCSQEGVRIKLLGGFGVHVGGQSLALPPSAQRLLVPLALRSQDVDRLVLGATLYPDARSSQVSANLRSSLWRTKQAVGRTIVEAQGQRLRLSAGVEVDLPP